MADTEQDTLVPTDCDFTTPTSSSDEYYELNTTDADYFNLYNQPLASTPSATLPMSTSADNLNLLATTQSITGLIDHELHEVTILPNSFRYRNMWMLIQSDTDREQPLVRLL
jgi:hypothetical protein